MGNQFGCNGCISCSTQLPPSTLTAEDKISLERISMSGLSSDVVKALATVGITPTSDCSHVKAELLLQVFSDLDKDRRDGSTVEVVEEEILEEEEEDSDGEASSSHPGQEELAPSNRVYSRAELKALSIQESMVIFNISTPISPEMNIKVRKIMSNLIDEDEENKERDPSFRDCGVGYNDETSKNTRFIRVSACVA